ncbi:hypothetical protein GH714_040744 [Hevea brasiliensis]|uniref:Galactose mutarotase-like domain-containing protein n=1 Tax=Hevea brasiliensis TaxID=3981 RepID=A0A6A6MVH1_HEVBR|nr:hypothetical protein GH714_040744 [Hevea brasiliensis]
MADTSHGPSSFWTQADALLRKNLTYQKRNAKTNCRLILFPFILCILLVITQSLLDHELNKASRKCGCKDVDINGNGQLEKVCGLQYSDAFQAATCSIPSPPQWPPLLQIPAPQYRAVRSEVIPFTDLPNDSCRSTGSCPVTILFTGNNQSLGENLAGNMFPSSFTVNSSNYMDSLAYNALGSDTEPKRDNFIDPAFIENSTLYYVQHQCASNSTLSISVQSVIEFQKEAACVQDLKLWRNSSSEINEQLFKGYRKGNSDEKINEILAAYDFLNSNGNNFNVSIWYNSTYKEGDIQGQFNYLRVPRFVNLVSNAYLQFFQGPGTKMLFEFVKEMPKAASKINVDLASLLGTLSLHGLFYSYFLYIAGLKFFTLNDYGIQIVFYFIYINLQISVAFLVAAFFSNVKTATVVGYIGVFGTGLLGGFLFANFVEDSSFPRGWIIVLELYPGFSLYRGLYEFSQYTFTGNAMGTHGMRWGNLSDSKNGMRQVLIIMFVEWQWKNLSSVNLFNGGLLINKLGNIVEYWIRSSFEKQSVECSEACKARPAIILTTHSMEEAEALCDRLGVFVDGSLQCIGNPKELKGRYGGSYVFTMTTSLDHEQEVVMMVQQLSPMLNGLTIHLEHRSLRCQKMRSELQMYFMQLRLLKADSQFLLGNDSTYFGNIVGRVANRITGAQFTLNGTLYKLVPNEGKNMLHGGPKGFSEVVWKVHSYNKNSHITFTYDSFDGEEGFPGDLSVSVTYMLIGTNRLAVKMFAQPLNKATPVNLALHTYWNLGGHNSGNILSHTIQLFGSQITPVDNDLLPTGKVTPVKGTPFDFLEPREIGSKFNELPDGYDINYVLEDLNPGHLKKVAVVKENISGRKLELWTNKPGLQFYTSNKLDNVKGKDGFIYKKHAGICLETQGFPDSVNQPNFPSQIVNPGETYKHVMIYRFTAS